MSYDHIVEVLLDDLPAYIREEYPKFVEMLRIYYKFQAKAGGVVETIWGQESRLDVDRDGLDKAISSLGLDDVPPDYRRDFLDVQKEYFAQQGSKQGIKDYLRIFHGLPCVITDTGKYVLEPSAAKRVAWQKVYVKSSGIVDSAVLEQLSIGAQADVAQCVAVTNVDLDGNQVYELLLSPRRRKEFESGQAQWVQADLIKTVEILPIVELYANQGQGYKIGDRFKVQDATGVQYAMVDRLKPIALKEVSVTSGGANYKVGDLIGIEGARGWRAEVSAVNAGVVTQVRVLDVGEGVKAIDRWLVTSEKGSGLVLSASQPIGIPESFSTDREIVGQCVVTVLSASGTGIQYSNKQYTQKLVYQQIGFNGVIGIGSVITDSSAWQQGSYRIAVPSDPGVWSEGFYRYHYIGGRVATLAMSVDSKFSIPAMSFQTNIVPVAMMTAGAQSGQIASVSL